MHKKLLTHYRIHIGHVLLIRLLEKFLRSASVFLSYLNLENLIRLKFDVGELRIKQASSIYLTYYLRLVQKLEYRSI